MRLVDLGLCFNFWTSSFMHHKYALYAFLLIGFPSSFLIRSFCLSLQPCIIRLQISHSTVSKSSKQGRKEYVSEVKITSRLRHRNLVQLIGWCHVGDELLLVYELMPNGSLDSHVHSTGNVLSWQRRYLGRPPPYYITSDHPCIIQQFPATNSYILY
jgi:hypothetical protein